MATPRNKRKRPPMNSPGDTSTICPICLDPIIDATEDTEGHEAIYCESTCNAWIHRQCAGLSQTLYKMLQEGEDPFYCPHCRLSIQENQLQELKSTIDNLTQEVTALKVPASPINEVINPQGSSPKSQLDTQSNPVVSVTNRQTQSATTAKKFDKADDKAQGDRKFNVVIYGINECSKGTPRNERLTHDLDKVTSIVTEGENSINPLSIRDLLRLGKYRDQSTKPCPILVRLTRTIDVSLLLSKAKSLSKDIRIKPDMSQEERLIESLLLKERWSLIQSGIEHKVIRIRYNKIFVQNKLHGQIINSSFILSQSPQTETAMESSNN